VANDFIYRILVLDDEESIRKISVEVLSRGGNYQVLTAADGFEGLALMRKALPDVIISDLKMPNMSGFEFLSIVRRRFPQIPVIAITGEFVGQPDPAGLLADAFFHKGEYSPQQLFSRIRELLEQCPIRPHLPKRDQAPVWIPRNGTYYVLTCTDCLRSFSIPVDEAQQGDQELPCIHCGTRLKFVLESKHQ
jgi:CheY-like chemotaxis protein/DNA-directed RNA polymerase subunit RPC12/RpoP